MQDHAADQLHVVVPHVQHAASGFAHDGERLGQQVVERLAVGEARAELAVLPRSCSSLERLDAGSNALISATRGRSRFNSRSFWVPTTLVRS